MMCLACCHSSILWRSDSAQSLRQLPGDLRIAVDRRHDEPALFFLLLLFLFVPHTLPNNLVKQPSTMMTAVADSARDPNQPCFQGGTQRVGEKNRDIEARPLSNQSDRAK